MRILVTGGSGFIGRQAITVLLEAGIDDLHVVALTTLQDEFPTITWHRIDLLDPDARRDLIARLRPSHLLHLAWTTEPGRFWHDSRNVDWVAASIDLTQRFIDAGGRRLVAAGSCAEYSPTEARPCVEAETRRRPQTLYGIAKDAFQRVLAGYAPAAGLSHAWGRVFLLYGPHEPAQRLVPYVIQQLLAGELALCASGQPLRDFMHVRDVGAAFAALLLSEVEGAVNIASGRPLSLADMIRRIGRLLDQEALIRLGAQPDRSHEPQYLTADVGRLRDEVGFRPRYGLDDGLRATIAWWREDQAQTAPR